jgi:hypothetical protein
MRWVYANDPLMQWLWLWKATKNSYGTENTDMTEWESWWKFIVREPRSLDFIVFDED